jgi:hypothetical protein
VGADGYRDGFEQGGADQAGGWGVEIKEGVGSLTAPDATLVAERDDCVSESVALLWGVDLLGDRGQRVPAPVGIVILDGLAQALQVGSDQGGQCGQQ